jgi:hypothetical protein
MISSLIPVGADGVALSGIETFDRNFYPGLQSVFICKPFVQPQRGGSQ